MNPSTQKTSESPGVVTWLWRRLYTHPQRVVVSLLIGGGFLWIFRRGGLPLWPAPSAFAQQQWWALPAYVLVTLFVTHFRTYRWNYLVRPLSPDVSRWRVLGMGYVGFTAVQLAPLRLGEVVRPYLLANDGEVKFFQALGTVAAERTIDGLVLTLLSFLTLTLSHPLSPLPDKLGDLPLPVKAVPPALYLALVAFASAFVLMALFYWARSFARRLVHGLIGLASVRLADGVTGVVERVADGLRFLPSRGLFGAFMRDTLIYWALGVFAQLLLLRGLGIQASWIEAAVTLGVMGVGTVIPSGPGFFGAYQISAYAGLALFYDAPTVLSSGAAFVFLSYATQILVNLFCGALGFWLMRRFPPPAASALAAS